MCAAMTCRGMRVPVRRAPWARGSWGALRRSTPLRAAAMAAACGCAGRLRVYHYNIIMLMS